MGGYAGAAWRTHRRRWRRLRWGIAIALLVGLLIVGGYVSLRISIARAFGPYFPFGPTFAYAIQSGGWAANAAASVAAKEHVPLGSLSASTLNIDSHKYQWVDGASAVPYSSSLQQQVVGLSVDPTHLVTVVQSLQGTCSFGLTITSHSDPLVVTHTVGGPGTYYQWVVNGSPCIANQAPMSSAWTPWNPAVGGHP